MNKEYILLAIIIIGTLTIIGMFIHINAKVGMRKSFLELINTKSFLAITVIIINTVISYAMIHFNNIDEPLKNQNIQKEKEKNISTATTNSSNSDEHQNGGDKHQGVQIEGIDDPNSPNYSYEPLIYAWNNANQNDKITDYNTSGNKVTYRGKNGTVSFNAAGVMYFVSDDRSFKKLFDGYTSGGTQR